MSPTSEPRTEIEASIESARKLVAERVDAIDQKLRGELDMVRRVAGENAPQLIAAGVATGIVLGYALPKPLFRIVQIATAVGIATVVAQKIAERAACDAEGNADCGMRNAE